VFLICVSLLLKKNGVHWRIPLFFRSHYKTSFQSAPFFPALLWKTADFHNKALSIRNDGKEVSDARVEGNGSCTVQMEWNKVDSVVTVVKYFVIH